MPQIDEDIEVKRMKRLEQLRLRRPFHSIAEDGSGWVSLSPKHPNSVDQNLDISPPRRHRTRNDTPSPEPELRPTQRRQDTPSPEPGQSQGLNSEPGPDGDISPPRRRRARNNTPSPDPKRIHSDYRKEDDDLLPPWQLKKNYPVQLPDISPSRRPHSRTSAVYEPGQTADLSPPRRNRACNDTPSPEPSRSRAQHGREDDDLSPHRQQKKRGHTLSPDMSPPRRPHSRRAADYDQKNPERSESPDLSPPQRVHHRSQNMDLSPPRRGREDAGAYIPFAPSASDLSPPRKYKKGSVPIDSYEQRKGGLISAQDTSEEIAKTKQDEQLK